MHKFFLRNDDVCEALDEALVYLTEQVVDQGLVITHAVEPANVSREVVDWLLRLKQVYPNQIEIIQHGFDHKLKTASPVRGEFGGGRPFEEQLNEVQQGADMMDRFFGDDWSRIFSFPYGSYDLNTLKALEQCQFKKVSTGIRFSCKRRMFNRIGHQLKKKTFMRRNIVYFNEQVPGFDLFEIPVVLNNTKRQTGPDSAIQRTVSELEQEWNKLPRWLDVCGILCHHRFNSKLDIDQLVLFMCRLRDSGMKDLKIEDIHA